MQWLDSVQEPEEWEEYSIDDPVWAWNLATDDMPCFGPEYAYKGHFAGVSEHGFPQVFCDGRTSHTGVRVEAFDMVSKQDPRSAQSST